MPQSLIKPRESWSEWQDLNLRPPRPERGVLPWGAGGAEASPALSVTILLPNSPTQSGTTTNVVTAERSKAHTHFGKSGHYPTRDDNALTKL